VWWLTGEELFGITALSADLGVSAFTKFEAVFESFIQAEKEAASSREPQWVER
jgi:hypothetical protein